MNVPLGGYDPIPAYDGEEAISKFKEETPDVVLLDVMLPKKSGFDVCKYIRKTSNVPILMITARSDDFDKIMGLDIGADDYIVKPFSGEEVMARIRAVFRRVGREDNNTASILQCGDLTINLNNYSAFIGDKRISLTKKEFELLWILAADSNKVFSRGTLLNTIWGEDFFGDIRIVNKHISRLRTKLKMYTENKMTIATIRGVGYKFNGDCDVQE